MKRAPKHDESPPEKMAVYPPMIKALPEADIPFKGVKGWLLQGDRGQVVFFEIEPTAEVAPHSHGAQWGIVLEGEMDFTIGSSTRRCRKGDVYYIPPGVVHSATFLSHLKAVDFFEDKDRYRPKRAEGSATRHA